MDIRKIIIIFVVAILFSIFVFSTIEAVYPEKKWDDFCNKSPFMPLLEKPVEPDKCTNINVSKEDAESCAEKKGYIEYERGQNGCAISYYCKTCQEEYESKSETHNVYVFYISAFFALIAVFLGLYLPAGKNPLNEWIGTGLMLGGTFVLFFGTLRSFQSLDRYVRPIVILIELLIVIFISYRKIGNLRKKKLE